MTELKIGPVLTVNTDDGYLPTMQDAYDTDGEKGAHWLNNAAADEFAKSYPTVIAMARLIEKQRDALLSKLKEANLDLSSNSITELIEKIEKGKY